jgi:hypothetical protein
MKDSVIACTEELKQRLSKKLMKLFLNKILLIKLEKRKQLKKSDQPMRRSMVTQERVLLRTKSFLEEFLFMWMKSLEMRLYQKGLKL